MSAERQPTLTVIHKDSDPAEQLKDCVDFVNGHEQFHAGNLEARLAAMEADIGSLKHWRTFVLGIVATVSVIFGATMAVLGLAPWKK